jgi:hypothetical protein
MRRIKAPTPIFTLHNAFEQPGAGPSSPIGILARFKVVTPEFSSRFSAERIRLSFGAGALVLGSKVLKAAWTCRSHAMNLGR